MLPKQNGILPSHFHKIITKIFSNFKKGEAVLSGGCALTEYYLGHRKADDIDIFVSDHSIINTVCDCLERSFTLIAIDEQGPNSFVFNIRVGEHDVPVHCIYLSKIKSEIQQKWTNHFEGVFLHDCAFIAAWKVNRPLNEDNYDVLRDLVDLYYIISRSGDIPKIVEAFIDIGRELIPYPYEISLPHDQNMLSKITTDIELSDIDGFAKRFESDFDKLYRLRLSC